MCCKWFKEKIAGCYSICCCQCNWALFPAPYPTYNAKEFSDWGEGIKLCEFKTDNTRFPYLEMKVNDNKECLIYFHGNAQDIGTSVNFLLPIQKEININIYVIEYPTYGVYTDDFPICISDKIKSNSLLFFDHLIEGKKIDKKNIIIFGRSIGSGPATYLASQRKNSNLILMSPLSSIRSVAVDFVGCIGNCLVKQHFDNISCITNYEGRLLIIHGKIDEVIAFRHGQLLYQMYYEQEKQNYCFLVAPLNMSHNYFDMKRDIVQPIKKFIKER